MMSLFVMAVATMLVVTILDIQALQYASLRNTMDYDRSRYLAEAGVAHTLAILEQDFDSQDLRNNGVGPTTFPVGSGNSYSATVADQPNGTVLINAEGTAGQFTRRLQITVKMGG
jgi:type II secretory pathway component PulK